jgi:hypothetical protein
MPSENERPENMPDTSETYERGHPGKTPGGTLDSEIGTSLQPDSVQGSVRNDDDPPELAGQDRGSSADRVDPSDPAAHAGRADAAEHPEADDAGVAPQDSPHGK